MRTLRRTPTALLLPAALLLWPTAAEAEQRVALVIGNTDYQALPPLRTAAVDARQLSAALESLGYETVLGVDLDSEEIQLAVQELAREAGDAEAAVFAYFGHGLQVDQLNYLLPTDFGTEQTPDASLDALALRTVLQAASQADIGVVLVDAARASGLDLPGTAPGLARPATLPPDVVLGYSAEPGMIVEDDVLFQSPYGSALAEAVTEPGLPLRDLLLRVRQAVVNETAGEQQPVVYGPVETIEFSINPAAEEIAETEGDADAVPEMVAELPEDRAPAGLPAPPEGEVDPVVADPAIEGAPDIGEAESEGATALPAEEGPAEEGEELIDQAAEAAPEADEVEMGAEPPPVAEAPEDPVLGADPDIEIEVEPPDTADTVVGEPLAEPENPAELPAPPLPIPTDPGGAAQDVDVGEMDPEMPREVTATPDPDGIAPSPAEAREEVATPEDAGADEGAEDPQMAALRDSPQLDPELTAEQRRAVQRSLHILGLYDYHIDAIFGPLTREGMRAFQERIGAEATGRLSMAQIERLHEMAEAEPPAD